MNERKISIIIKSNYDISAVASLLQQSNSSWECFVINNTVKNIEQYIINDNRFFIFNDLGTAIQSAHGEYILLVDSNDILVADAIDNILHMIEFTNADIIKFNSGVISDTVPESSDKKCHFKYVFNKDSLMEYVFNNLSEFCFKKNIIKTLTNNEHSFLVNILSNAKDLTFTNRTYIIKQTIHNVSVDDIIDNYNNNRTKLSDIFWKKYFQNITPQIIKNSIQTDDKKSFIKFCKTIPLQFIPLRYRIMCYILKKTNK